MKNLLAALLLLCLCVSVVAQNNVVSDANITGHIIEKKSGEHLPYYNVIIKSSHLATMTDASGHYIFRDLRPGKYTIEATCPGYATQTKKVEVETGRTVEVNFDVEPDVFLLDQVVVTSSKSEIKRRNAPSMVNVLDSHTLSLVSAASLADGLNFQPGVRVENDCQNCGFTQVRINGLDGHYSQILMNSRPVFSALTGVYGLEQIPATMIDRVEIMRGGGSALFGSSAVGGTINIITKDPVVNSASLTHQLTSIGISGSFDNNTTLNASVVTDNNRAGLFVYGQSRYRDGYDNTGDGFTELAALKTQTVGARAFLRTSDRTRLTLEYHNTHEYRRGGDQLDQPAHMAMICEEVDHNINAGEATFDIWDSNRDNHLAIFAATQNTRRKSYYGSEMDPDAYGRTSDIVVTAGSQWTHNMKKFLFMPAELVAGIEYNYNRLHDVTIGYNHNALQNVNIFSGYLQNEWRNDTWGFLVGARADKHSMIDHVIVSPRFNVRYNPSKSLNLRLSYSTGFRSPQAYDEDFHIAVVGGARVVTVLAKDLREENSNSFSASADWRTRIGGTQANFTVEGFFTDLSNVFALRQLDEPDDKGNDVLERYNGSGARVFGGTFEAKLSFPWRMQLQSGITVQRSRYKQPETWSDNPDVPATKKMFRTPEVYGYITVDYDITKKLCCVLNGTLTGPMTVQHLAGSGTEVDRAVNTPAFFDMGIKINYTWRLINRINLIASVGVQNIFNSYQKDFDQGYLRDSGYIYGPALPRSLTASLQISI